MYLIDMENNLSSWKNTQPVYLEVTIWLFFKSEQ